MKLEKEQLWSKEQLHKLNHSKSSHRPGSHSCIQQTEGTDLVGYMAHSVETLDASKLSTGAKGTLE